MRLAAPTRLDRLRILCGVLSVLLVMSAGVWAQNSSEPPAPATAPQGSQPQNATPAPMPQPATAGGSQAPSIVPAPENSAPSATPDNGNSQQTPISAEPSGQEPANDQMFVFKKQVEEVVLHATVMDEQHHLVPYLDKSAFTVYQDGVPQTITSFRREDIPVAIGIVVDNSGSMRDKRDKINQAVLNLIRVSNPKDEIFVVNFSQNYYLDQDFTSDVNLLRAALRQVSTRGTTALYDAIVASSVHLRNNPRLEKKVLLVITDGQDNMSQETLQEAERRLEQANGPTLYAIGLLGSGMQSEGRDALQSLADGTGGVAYFPQNLSSVDEITRAIAHDIRSQYYLTYKPHNQNAKPPYQSVRVDAHAPGYRRLIVRTRTGFFPAENGH